MGSTISCEKRAAAFRSEGGGTVWVLFESTYSSNCFPHTPDWSCTFLGDLRGAIQRIFDYASSCEGGMLKTKSGRITPEGYIAGWMKELACPIEMPDIEIDLKCRDGFYAIVSKENLDAVCDLVGKYRSESDAKSLRNGETVVCKLHADHSLLSALIAEARVDPWRVVGSCSVPIHRSRNPDLGYNPQPFTLKRSPIRLPQALKAGEHEFLLKEDDGRWYAAGWAYSIVGQFVSSCWVRAITEPGSYRKNIKLYRAALESAAEMPSGTRAIVNESALTTAWGKDRAAQLKKCPEAIVSDTGFVVPANASNLYGLCNLPREAVTWLVPDAQPALFAA